MDVVRQRHLLADSQASRRIVDHRRASDGQTKPGATHRREHRVQGCCAFCRPPFLSWSKFSFRKLCSAGPEPNGERGPMASEMVTPPFLGLGSSDAAWHLRSSCHGATATG